MKIDRLIGILSILLQKEAVTAPELAERFEVSRRTIGRDIEALCKAGIPIVTRQGANGGISIMENYKLDRALLTRAEMQDIFAGLRSLDSINGTNKYKQLMNKLSVGSSDFLIGDQSVLIDLASWYKASLVPKIEQIRAAIDRSMELEFQYFAPSGESERCIEPYYLIFHWSSWYVWGFCKWKGDYRLFKLNRMDKVSLSGRVFARRYVPLPDLSDERIFPGGISVKALFEADCKWRLVEEFGTGCFTVRPDGRLLFQAEYTDKENLLTWLLSFREKAELLEPESLRAELAACLENTWKRYRQEEGRPK